MSAMPEPAPKPASESDVDAVLEKIDACLPKIHKRAAEAAKNGDTPTDGFSPAKIKQTKMAFQAMSEDKLLSDSNEKMLDEMEKEAQRAAEERRKDEAVERLYGKKPEPQKRTLFFRGRR
jgi:hypothetical protein